MSVITPQTVAPGGTAVTFAAASGGGDVVLNALHATLRVRNDDSASHTVTLTGVVNCSHGSLHDTGPITIAATSEKDIPIPSDCVNPTTGSAAVAYSAVTSVSVAAIAG